MMNLRDTLIGDHVAQTRLQQNKKRRESAKSLVPTDRDEYITGEEIMKEIMGRRRARMEMSRNHKASYQEKVYGVSHQS